MEPVILYLKSLAPALMALVALIFLDVMLGIAKAIREHKFRWRELGDFYLTMVIPFLIGWLAFSITAQFSIVELLGPQYGQIASNVTVGFAWMAIVAVLVNSVIKNAKTLYGSFPFGQPKNDNPEPGE